jgi:hypothetical protein
VAGAELHFSQKKKKKKKKKYAPVLESFGSTQSP